MRNFPSKNLHEKNWFWYFGALVCIALSIYWFIIFAVSHELQNLVVGIVILGLGLLAIKRGSEPPTQEPPDLEQLLRL